MDILQELLKHAAQQSNATMYKDRSQAEKDLRAFLEQAKEDSGISVGDMIERNDLGRKRYRHPQDGTVAICVDKFAEPIMDADGNELATLRIAVAIAENQFRYYDVNGAYYRKSGANTTNIFNFKKK